MNRLLRVVYRAIPVATGGALCLMYPRYLSTGGVTSTTIDITPRVDPPLPGTANAIKLANAGQQYSGNIKADFESLVKRVQDEICNELTRIDGTPFAETEWARPGNGGGGRSRVLEGGAVFEKAGVNVSIVHGAMPKAAAHASLPRKVHLFSGPGPFPFHAVGISLVLHPRNPFAPTMHANYRYFEATGVGADGLPETTFWFGGGSDLTPHYLFPEDCAHFHGTLKTACDAHDPSYYPAFKQWADDYFNIPHRNERRGIGGIFFDDLSRPGPVTFPLAHAPSGEREAAPADPYSLFPFMVTAAASIMPAYVPVLLARKDTPYTPEQHRWQQLRHGRYVEFNLVNDRGTKFGLAMPGSRTESILMSLPSSARWEYCHEPAEGSPEAAMAEALQQQPPRDWLA